MAKNPTAYTGIVLGENQGIEALGGYFDKIINATEQIRQRKELQAANIAEDLLPLDVNMDDLFTADHRQEIMDMLDGYEKERLDFLANAPKMTKKEVEAGKSRFKRMENDIENRIALSKQQKEVAKSFLDKRATGMINGTWEDNIDDTQSMLNLSGLISSGDILSGDKYLQQKGSLLVAAPWDEQEYLKKNTFITQGMYSENKPEITTEKGTRITKTVSDIPEAQKTAQTRVFLYGSQKGAKQYLAKQQMLFDQLDPVGKAKYMNDAVLNGHADPLVEFSKRDIALMFPTKTAYSTNQIASGGGGGRSSSNQNDYSAGSLFVDMIVGLKNQDPAYMKMDFDMETNPNAKSDKGGSKGIGDIAGQIPVNNVFGRGSFVSMPMGKFMYVDPDTNESKETNEIIEEFVSDGNNVYKISNRTRNEGYQDGGIDGAQIMTDAEWATLLQNGLNQMSVTEKKAAIEYMKQLGLIGDDNRLNLSAVTGSGATSDPKPKPKSGIKWKNANE